MTTKEEYAELHEVKRMIEGELFQKYIVERVRAYQDTLKAAYSCDTLKEIANIRGQKKGSDQFFNILKDIDKDFVNKKFELSDE